MRFRLILFLTLMIVPFAAEIIEAQNFQTGKIAVNLNNYGRVRVFRDSLTGLRQIDRSSFIGAVDTNLVFSYLLSAATADSFKNVISPAISDYEIYGSVNNTYDTSGQSPDFLVKHNIYGWNGTAYLLVKITVQNNETRALNTALGMEIISELDGSYGLETVYWLAENKIVAQFRPPASTYVGYKILSAPTKTVRLIDWYDGYNTVNPDLYHWMTDGVIDTLFESGGDGAVAFFAQNFTNIPAAGESVIWIGIAIGDQETDMIANMNLAEVRYTSVVGVHEENEPVPSAYRLLQNYPNPFNPETAIRFSIPESGFVTLKVYDLLGNEVADLVHQDMNAGTYSINYNAVNLSSGVYFYRLSTGNYSETKKMNLLK